MCVVLAAGELRLMLDPETGGAIAAFTCGGTALLRPVSDPRLGAQHGRAVAGYPLIPFANRVGWGRFFFDGKAYQLARNFDDDPHTIHGNAWMHPWTVAGSSGRSARLTLDFRPEGALSAQWPFAYHAEQVFDLDEDALRIVMRVENRDTEPFPAGIGLHPYVARTPETVLRFVAGSVWTAGPDELPALHEAVHGDFAFDHARALGETEIDACYAGWDGAAEMRLPEHGVTLTLRTAPPVRHLQLYTPVGRDFIGLEPVTNMPDAVNRMDDMADHGLVILQPGEAVSASITIGVRRSG